MEKAQTKKQVKTKTELSASPSPSQMIKTNRKICMSCYYGCYTGSLLICDQTLFVKGLRNGCRVGECNCYLTKEDGFKKYGDTRKRILTRLKLN